MLARTIARTLFYPTLAWNMLLLRLIPGRNWWDHIDERVIVGALPFAASVAELHSQGVRAVVNTCEEYKGPGKQYQALHIEQFHMPTSDFTHPHPVDVVRAVEFIEAHVNRNETVYVHCKAGRARSATVALCWLIRHRGMSIQEGQQHLLQCRPHVKRNLHQRAVVRQFAQSQSDSDPCSDA